MVFSSAVAGPSRIPYSAATCAHAQAAVRSFSSSACTQAPGGRRPFRNRQSGEEAEGEGGEGRRSQQAEPTKDFGMWLKNEGVKLKSPGRYEKARWLGGEVPFASNPSFRPPPPISDDLQTILFNEVRSGKRTTGQIAHAYSVSKARIDAVRKLKEVEAEFKRQNLPLQRAFQAGMESLLGVQSILDSKNVATMETIRKEELQRSQHPSTGLEHDEEHRHDHGHKGGAFANHADPDQRPQSTIEMDVWEFRDETTVMADRVAAVEAVRAEKAAEKAAEEAEAADFAAGKTAKKAAPAVASVVAKAGKTTFRFVDTSKKE